MQATLRTQYVPRALKKDTTPPYATQKHMINIKKEDRGAGFLPHHREIDAVGSDHTLPLDESTWMHGFPCMPLCTCQRHYAPRLVNILRGPLTPHSFQTKLPCPTAFGNRVPEHQLGTCSLRTWDSWRILPAAAARPHVFGMASYESRSGMSRSL